MRRLSQTHKTLVLACLLSAPVGCFEDVPPGGTSGDGDGDTTGDGDSPGDGDGDTSGDGDTTGDGDTATGDGDGDTASGDGDGDTTGDEPCGSGYACIPDPGPAWDGPIAIQDMANGCGDAYPDELEALFAGLAVDPGGCECSCGQPNVMCSTTMSVIGFGSNNCVDGQGSQAISQNQCYNTFAASHAVSLAPASSSCGPGDVAADLPEPSFSSSVLACGDFQPGAGTCEAGAVCVPEPDPGALGGLCYWSAGDVACPAGYPNKTLYATEVEDTRTCADSCTCSATQAVCQVSVTGYAGDNCISAQGNVSTDSGSQVCAAVSPAVNAIRPGNVSVKNAGSCNPSPVPVMGEVSLSGATTVCCSG